MTAQRRTFIVGMGATGLSLALPSFAQANQFCRNKEWLTITT